MVKSKSNKVDDVEKTLKAFALNAEPADDVVSDEEVAQSMARFLERRVVKDPSTGEYEFPRGFDSDVVGERVRAYQAKINLDDEGMATRFGLEPAVAVGFRESNVNSAGGLEAAARTLGQQFNIGVLKALRVLKEVEAHCIVHRGEVDDDGPILLAARKRPKE